MAVLSPFFLLLYHTAIPFPSRDLSIAAVSFDFMPSYRPLGEKVVVGSILIITFHSLITINLQRLI